MFNEFKIHSFVFIVTLIVGSSCNSFATDQSSISFNANLYVSQSKPGNSKLAPGSSIFERRELQLDSNLTLKNALSDSLNDPDLLKDYAELPAKCSLTPVTFFYHRVSKSGEAKVYAEEAQVDESWNTRRDPKKWDVLVKELKLGLATECDISVSINCE